MNLALRPQALISRGFGLRCSMCLTVAAMVILTGCTVSKTQTSVPLAAEPTVLGTPQVDARRRAKIRLELAAEYFQAGRMNVAMDEVGQALASDPDYPDAYGLLGLILMQNRDYEKADVAMRKAISLSPQDGNLIHNYAWMLCQQKHYAEADQWFDKAMAQPNYVERSKTLLAKGLCYQQAGQPQKAEKTLLTAYELDLNNPVVAYNLANVTLQAGDAKKAQFYIRRLNRTRNSNAQSLWLAIRIERSLRDDLAVKQLAQQLRERYPDSREWLAFERGAFDE